MKFRKNYKYQVAEDEVFKTSILGKNIIKKRLELHPDGTLIIREGYACDGPSGPVMDRKTNMTASVLHDALYQMMREKLLPHYYWRMADVEYGRELQRCGAWDITVRLNLAGLSYMKGKYALPENRKKIYEAP